MKLNLVTFVSSLDMSVMELIDRLVNTAESVNVTIYIGIYDNNFNKLKENYSKGINNIIVAKRATHGRVPTIEYVDLKRQYYFTQHFTTMAYLLKDEPGYTYFLKPSNYVSNELISYMTRLNKVVDYLVFTKYEGKKFRYKHNISSFIKDNIPSPDVFVFNNKILSDLECDGSLNWYCYWLYYVRLFDKKRTYIKVKAEACKQTKAVSLTAEDAVKELQEVTQLIPKEKKFYSRLWIDTLKLRLMTISKSTEPVITHDLTRLMFNLAKELHIIFKPTSRRIRYLEREYKRRRI